MELREIIKEFSALSAPSGSETPAAERIAELLTPLVDEVKIDALGNVIGVKKSGIEGAPRMLLDAHMDEVGFIVNYITSEGYLRITSVGGINPETVIGRVTGDAPAADLLAPEWSRKKLTVIDELDKLLFESNKYQGIAFNVI